MNNNTNNNDGQELSPEEKRKAYKKAYYLANKEKLAIKSKIYYEDNKERTLARQKKYTENNKDKVLSYQKEYYKSNKEIVLARQKEYSIQHADQIKEYKQKNRKNIDKQNAGRHKERCLTDPEFALKTKLRKAVCRSFTRIKQNKPADTLTLLGCTWEEARAHFESLFQEGMSWENHGEWHIDHIRPVASFSLNELKLMNHISNLQPLWAKDNFEKSDTWN